MFAYAAFSADPIQPLPSDITLSQALNNVCEEKTRTQQLLKDYLMIGLNSCYNKPDKNLEKLIALFDVRLYDIKHYFVPKIQKLGKPDKAQMIEDAITLWEKDKIILTNTPTKEGAIILKKDFKILLGKLKAVRVLLKKSFVIVKKTGALCIEPLKMSNLYIMKAWEIDNPTYKVQMEKSIKKVHGLFKQLKDYEYNDKSTLIQIEKAERAFMYFEFMYAHESTFIPSLIYKKSDHIFDTIRALKKMYIMNAKK
jgi:hypothetical protein